MAEKLFLSVFHMSLTGGLVILAVLALRAIMRKAPKIFSYCLWAVVLFRLLCPVSFSSAFSLFGFLPAPGIEPGILLDIREGQSEFTDPAGYVTEEVGLAQDIKLHDMQDTTANGGQKTKKGILSHYRNGIRFASGIWLLGILIMFFYSAASLAGLKRKLKGAAHENANIYITDRIRTPFVIGFLKPRIYLPEALSGSEREYILLHEQIHIRRGDHLVKPAAYLTLCLHWFNPLVWAAFFLSEKDMEMSCDEAVIRKLGNSIKKDYSSSLLALASGSHLANGAPLAFGEGDTGSRIKNILRYQKPKAAIVALAIAICMSAAVLLLANPASAKKTNSHKTTAESTSGGGKLSTNDAGKPTANNAGKPSADSIGSAKNTPKEKENASSQKEAVSPDEPVVLGKNAEGTFSVNVRSIARSSRTIDLYVSEYGDSFEEAEDDPSLAFANDCVYKANYSMTGTDYREISFDEFADLISANNSHHLNKPCLLTFRDNLIVEAILKSAYVNNGISYSKYTSNASIYEYLSGQEGESAFHKHYTLARKESADLSNSKGAESIEVYTGNCEYAGDSGIVMVKAADGTILHMEDCGTARAGWNNVYLGETKEGTPYLLKVYIEDRDTYGAYGFWAYRFGQNGKIQQLAGSEFEFHFGSATDVPTYDDALFQTWAGNLSYYLENSFLLLSTQDSEIRTEKACDADRYNYATLSLKDRSRDQ